MVQHFAFYYILIFYFYNFFLNFLFKIIDTTEKKLPTIKKLNSLLFATKIYLYLEIQISRIENSKNKRRPTRIQMY